ncbi:hypothetical protein WR25_07372 [Diploscapter pachys]|uniref:Uncharacterized protein n=1 Tax=Diploscapter pachys TaxID=2018661 RepID=A0A2A2M1J3_9BILA|nr:hypothetical protein WR25_07372 [Diploscapter pachys]
MKRIEYKLFILLLVAINAILSYVYERVFIDKYLLKWANKHNERSSMPEFQRILHSVGTDASLFLPPPQVPPPSYIHSLSPSQSSSHFL